MIICNGVPKNGTNLLQKTCALLGYTDSAVFLVQHQPGQKINARRILPNQKVKAIWADVSNTGNTHFAHAHVAYPILTDISAHKIINIWRDPRDAAISFIRWAHKRNKGYSNSEQGLITLLQDGYGGAKNWAQLYENYLGWLDPESESLNITWSQLKTKAGIEEVKEYLGASADINFVHDNLFGNGKTLPNGEQAYVASSSFSGEESNFHDYWSQEIEKIWQETGGPRILATLQNHFNTPQL